MSRVLLEVVPLPFSGLSVRLGQLGATPGPSWRRLTVITDDGITLTCTVPDGATALEAVDLAVAALRKTLEDRSP